MPIQLTAKVIQPQITARVLGLTIWLIHLILRTWQLNKWWENYPNLENMPLETLEKPLNLAQHQLKLPLDKIFTPFILLFWSLLLSPLCSSGFTFMRWDCCTCQLDMLLTWTKSNNLMIELKWRKVLTLPLGKIWAWWIRSNSLTFSCWLPWLVTFSRSSEVSSQSTRTWCQAALLTLLM